jgi:hypothetical protein
MGINTASIAAKMKVPNQGVSDVILEPRGNISEVLFSSLGRLILMARWPNTGLSRSHNARWTIRINSKVFETVDDKKIMKMLVLV